MRKVSKLMIIVVGSEKGGSGKSTVAINLAVMIAQMEESLLLVDTDQQGSSSDWIAERDHRGIDPQIFLESQRGRGLEDSLELWNKHYSTILVDTGGRDSLELRASMLVADKLIIPFQASQFDTWTLQEMEKRVVQAKEFNPKLESYVVISRAPTAVGSHEVKSAVAAVNNFPGLGWQNLILGDRKIYRSSIPAGQGIVEMPMDKNAVEEMKKLYSTVMEKDWHYVGKAKRA
jgi:chromosome partitioning protein